MSTNHRFARLTLVLAVAVFVGLPSASIAESPVHWDLTEIYLSDEAWDDALQDLASKETLLDAYKGRLGSDAKTLREVLEKAHGLQQQASRLSAYASMRGDEDLRESGPQGMRQSLQNVLAGVHLLSGGEKALSAIALLFAIFRFQPSPFCLLDEVDAALDETNVTRFTHMLAEYAKNTQFVLITHNKMSMEAAGVLYGVTMEEPGVSKIVSMQMH